MVEKNRERDKERLFAKKKGVAQADAHIRCFLLLRRNEASMFRIDPPGCCFQVCSLSPWKKRVFSTSQSGVSACAQHLCLLCTSLPVSAQEGSILSVFTLF